MLLINDNVLYILSNASETWTQAKEILRKFGH